MKSMPVIAANLSQASPAPDAGSGWRLTPPHRPLLCITMKPGGGGGRDGGGGGSGCVGLQVSHAELESVVQIEFYTGSVVRLSRDVTLRAAFALPYVTQDPCLTTMVSLGDLMSSSSLQIVTLGLNTDTEQSGYMHVAPTAAVRSASPPPSSPLPFSPSFIIFLTYLLGLHM